MSKRAIPLVDFSKLTSDDPSQRQSFVSDLGKAFHEIGFVGVVNHGIPKGLVDDFYRACRSFFALPVEVKRRYEVPGMAGQRGYTSFGKEHAKQAAVGDLKEFFQIGQEPLDEQGRPSEEPSANPTVVEVPDFLVLGMELYRAFERTGASLLQAIALHLSLDENYFDRHIRNGTSILRAIHYPPITTAPRNAMRAEQHEDINLITLLVGASAGGLQVLSMEGEWLDVVPEQDEIVINVGDMLQRLTNNYLRSTTHRVVNPPPHEWHVPRLSIPFFLHPQSGMDLRCLPSCVSEDRPLAYEPITAGDYLAERLREIGLLKA